MYLRKEEWRKKKKEGEKSKKWGGWNYGGKEIKKKMKKNEK